MYIKNLIFKIKTITIFKIKKYKIMLVIKTN